MSLSLCSTSSYLVTMSFEPDGSVRFTSLDIGDSLDDRTESFSLPDATKFLAALLQDRFRGVGEGLYGWGDAVEVVAYCAARGIPVDEVQSEPAADEVLAGWIPALRQHGNALYLQDGRPRTREEEPAERPWFQLRGWQQLIESIVEERCAGWHAYGNAQLLVERVTPPAGW